MTRLCCCGVVLVTLASAAVAAPRGDSVARAKLYLERGAALYREGRYAETITELNKGYALAPMPAFLYSLGQAERQAGDCVKAVEHYRAFLETEPSPRQRAATEDQLRRCADLRAPGTEPSSSQKGWSAGAMRARTESVAPAPEPRPPTAAVDLTIAAAPPPARAPAHRRRWVWALTGSLLAAAAIGATTAGVLLTRPNELEPGSFGRLDGRR